MVLASLGSFLAVDGEGRGGAHSEPGSLLPQNQKGKVCWQDTSQNIMLSINGNVSHHVYWILSIRSDHRSSTHWRRKGISQVMNARRWRWLGLVLESVHHRELTLDGASPMGKYNTENWTTCIYLEGQLLSCVCFRDVESGRITK